MFWKRLQIAHLNTSTAYQGEQCLAVRVGVIGTGKIGQDHIHRIANVIAESTVVAVSDIETAKAGMVAKSIGARTEASGMDLIKADDVDAVVVATIGTTHEEYVLAAIAEDKPVFCEKPWATTASACELIIDAETRRGNGSSRWDHASKRRWLSKARRPPVFWWNWNSAFSALRSPKSFRGRGLYNRHG